MPLRRLALTVLAAATLAALSAPAQADDGGTKSKAPRTLPGGWVYTWGDEFNGTKLDTKKWGYELGVIRNKGASQAYTKEAVRVKDGKLIITSKAEETPCCTYKEGATDWIRSTKSQPFSSGSVTTKDTMLFEPGSRLEVRAKIPSVKGSWPAIWMIHHNGKPWPACGETDILEHISQHHNKCYSTFHWGHDGTAQHRTKGDAPVVPKLCEEWCVYVLEWTEEEMVITVAGKETARLKLDSMTYADGSNPFRCPAHLILNTAIGGPGTWPEQPDASQYPCTYEIDYVRYYTQKGAAKDGDKKGKADKEEGKAKDNAKSKGKDKGSAKGKGKGKKRGKK